MPQSATGWGKICRQQSADISTCLSIFWKECRQCPRHVMIWNSYANLAELKTLTRPPCCRDSNYCFMLQRQREEFLRVMHARWQKSLAGKSNIHCISLLRSSWSDCCLKSIDDRCSNGLQNAKSSTGLSMECKHDSTALWKKWRRWRFRQGEARRVARRVRRKTLPYGIWGLFSTLPGFHCSWLGALFTRNTRLGPKSEPCVTFVALLHACFGS